MAPSDNEKPLMMVTNQESPLPISIRKGLGEIRALKHRLLLILMDIYQLKKASFSFPVKAGFDAPH